MPDDLYQILLTGETSPEETARALSAALRRQRAAGTLGTVSGDPVLGRLGGSLVSGADRGQEQLAELFARRQEAEYRRQAAASAAARKAAEDSRREQMEAMRFGLADAQFREQARHNRAAEGMDRSRIARESIPKPVDTSKAATALRQEFQGLQPVKDTQTILQSHEKIMRAEPTGPGDISMVFSFMKVLDPGSTVREGEYATAANAGGVPEKVAQVYNRILKGEKLPPELRAQFRSEADNLARSQLSRYDAIASQYRRLASQGGASPEDVVLPLGSRLSSGPSAPQPQARPEQSGAVMVLWKGQAKQISADKLEDALRAGAKRL